MTQTMLVPLDGSRFGEYALPRAMAMASRLGATLELVTVAEAQGGARSPEGVSGDESRERGKAAAAAYLEEVEERIRGAGFTGVVNRTALLPSNVANALVRHLLEVEAGLTVMTTHGRGAIRRAWLGSVADAFIRASPAPVLLVRPETDQGEARVDLSMTPEPFRRILVPLDGSEAGERLLPLSASLAVQDAHFILFRAVPTFTSGGSPYLPHVVRDDHEQKQVREAARGYLEGLAQTLRDQGRKADVEVGTAAAGPADSILRVIEDESVDLVAMSTEGRGGVSRLLLGSVADKVVRGSPVPVLVYRKPQSE